MQGGASLNHQPDRRIVPGFSAAVSPPAVERCLHAVFAERAVETPDAPAVTGAGRTLTYRELHEQSERLARYLRSAGVGPGVPVALLTDRSPDLAVAIVGVLKAGGACVPLDPAYPEERLAFVMDDARLPFVVAQERLAWMLPDRGARVVLLEDVPLPLAGTREPARAATPHDVAYVMYTWGVASGGVRITHGNVARLVREAGSVRFGAEEVFLQLPPLSFHASTLEIWAPLLGGGRLVMVPADAPWLTRLGDGVWSRGVTSLWLTAGLYQRLQQGSLESLAPLWQLLAAGR